MSEMEHVNQEDFQTQVIEETLPVLVDFTAAWCGPCKTLDPIVKQLAKEWAGRLKVVALDVDENPDVAAQYQVLGLPTLMLFVNGEVSERVSGYQPKDRLIAKFGPHLPQAA